MRQLSEQLKLLLDEASQRKSNRGGRRAPHSNFMSYTHQHPSAFDDTHLSHLGSGPSGAAGQMHEGSASTGMRKITYGISWEASTIIRSFTILYLPVSIFYSVYVICVHFYI